MCVTPLWQSATVPATARTSSRRPEGPGPSKVTNRFQVGGNAGIDEENDMSTTTPPTPADGDVDPNQFEWQLTRAHVDYVLHYTHWIPMGRGFTQQMLAKYYPGWTLGRLIRLFDAAGIRIQPDDLDGAPGAPHGGRCHWQVVAFYFTDETHFHVVWDRTREFDVKYTAHDLDDDTRRPGGVGPSRGKNIRATFAPRPVDLSGKTFFD